MGKSIEYGVQNISGSFDRRPNGTGVKVGYVKGASGAMGGSGANQKKSQGMTGSGKGSGKNSFGKGSTQKYDHKA
jgi:hypothetical protein